MLPALERRFDVLAPTLPGHAGGPGLGEATGAEGMVDWLERRLDAEGIEAAAIAGNSLGGYLALKLAARGRARSVVALAPAGGWPDGDPAIEGVHEHFASMHALVRAAAAQAEQIVATPEGRRRVTQFITERYEHIPPELLAHQIRGAAACDAPALIEAARRDGWALDAERIECPVRIVWGTEDRILTWPRAAERYRREWLPQADWIELDGVGHCPQLDVPAEAAELIAGFSTGSGPRE